MKIKSIILSLSCFILSVLGDDCDDFIRFFALQKYSLECCGNSHYVLCDKNNNIKSITLDASIMKNYYKPLSFDDFPLFPKLEHLTITNDEENESDPFSGVFPERLLELPSLKTLEIASSNISYITKDINPNSSVETIKLQHNNIKSFPYQFKHLPKLSYFDISFNSIFGTLTGEIKDFRSLKHFNLDSNYLEGDVIIPDSLEHISIIANKFTGFSKDNSYKNLKYIEAINNSFDDNIFSTLIKSENLKNNLKTLTLGYNKNIKTIPDEIYLLNSLESLDLSGTSISILPNNFFALNHLNYLNIAFNENLNSMFVNFKNQINVCDLTGTPMICFQPHTCKFVLGYNNYRYCYDYEIEQMHIVDDKVTSYVNKELDNKNDSNPLVKYLIFTGIACLILLIIIGCLVIYLYKERSNRQRGDQTSSKNKKQKIDEATLREEEEVEEVEDDDDEDEDDINNKVSFSNISFSVEDTRKSDNFSNTKNQSKIYAAHYSVGPIAQSLGPTIITNNDTNLATVQTNMDESNFVESTFTPRKKTSKIYSAKNASSTCSLVTTPTFIQNTQGNTSIVPVLSNSSAYYSLSDYSNDRFDEDKETTITNNNI